MLRESGAAYPVEAVGGLSWADPDPDNFGTILAVFGDCIGSCMKVTQSAESMAQGVERTPMPTHD